MTYSARQLLSAGRIALGVLSAVLCAASPAAGQEAPAAPAAAAPAGGAESTTLPVQARGLDVEEHVGRSLPLELAFTNAQGKQVYLSEYFGKGKPAIIAMVYYRCPVVCNVVMQRLTDTINAMDFTVGKDYNALLFTIDPDEDTALAAQTKHSFISKFTREVTPEVEAGWEFHTTDNVSSRRLADALGFRYRPLGNGNFSHPVALFIITPDGTISRYLYGFDYPARDVKLALIEASEGKLTRTVGDRIAAFCYLYDPNTGKYTLRAFRVMQVAGVITVVGLSTLIGVLFAGERMRRKARGAAAPAGDATQPVHESKGETAP